MKLISCDVLASLMHKTSRKFNQIVIHHDTSGSSNFVTKTTACLLAAVCLQKKGKIKEKFRLDNNLEVDKEYEDDDQDIEEEAS